MLQCAQLDRELGKDFKQWPAAERITISTLKKWEMEDFRAGTFSIKYVIEGTEHYFIHGKKFSVSAGQYLVVNAHQSVDILIEASRDVKCFCIHMTPEWMNEVHATGTRSLEVQLDQPWKESSTGAFEELLYSQEENELGAYLKNMAARFCKDSASITMDGAQVFYDLASRANSLKHIYPPAKDLRLVRNSTKQELLRRLSIARELMDQEFDQSLTMDRVARRAMLSTSHFLHCFKKVYGVSPHRYLAGKRLEHAAILIGKNYPLATIAEWCGYADGASFSKAFRKMYGKSPSEFRSI